jgi:GntR family transcriptional regulator
MTEERLVPPPTARPGLDGPLHSSGSAAGGGTASLGRPAVGYEPETSPAGMTRMPPVVPYAVGAGRPKYGQLMDALRARIRAGVYQIGELIPGESRLQAEFGVSRITVRRAVDELAREGILLKEQGRGTYVSRALEITQGLNTLSTVTDTLLQMGLTPENVTIRLEMEEAGESVAAALQIEPGAPVWHLTRLRGAHRTPICLTDNYILPDHVPGFSTELLRASLYETYEQVYGLTLARGEEIVTAGAATPEEAAKLDVRPGAPLLVVIRTTYLDNNQPIERAIVRSRPDRYRYAVTLSGRPRRGTGI